MEWGNDMTRQSIGFWPYLKLALLALPLAFGWTVYTAQPTPGNFALGYLFSLLGILATGLRGDSVKISNAFRQLYNLIAYTTLMAKEILVAGLKVAAIVLSPTMPIDPGLTEVNTGDESENELISAASAHGITITPGELVVDFKESSGTGVVMVVHSLNMAESGGNLQRDQAKRLKRIKGILGHD